MTQSSEEINPENISALLCATEDGTIMLPDASIAEIIEFQSTETEEGKPNWYLGQLTWRNISIPLISLEALNSDAFFTQSHQLKIIIFN